MKHFVVIALGIFFSSSYN